MKRVKRILSLVLALMFAAGFIPALTPSSKAAAGDTWASSVMPYVNRDKDFNFMAKGLGAPLSENKDGFYLNFSENTATEYLFVGDPEVFYDGLSMSFAKKVTVTLTNMNFSSARGADKAAANATIYFAEGGTLILEGENVIANGRTTTPEDSGAGVGVPAGKSLEIKGSGRLTVSSSVMAAAIGGGYKAPGGNITISENVEIKATGIGGAAGIGGGSSLTTGYGAGEITVSGNAAVEAVGGYSSSTNAGGAGIGGGGSKSGLGAACGQVSILGNARVTVKGGKGAAGIGGGSGGGSGGETARASKINVAGGARLYGFTDGTKSPLDGPVNAVTDAIADIRLKAPLSDTSDIKVCLMNADSFEYLVSPAYPGGGDDYTFKMPKGMRRAALFIPKGNYIISTVEDSPRAIAGESSIVSALPGFVSPDPALLELEAHDSNMLTLSPNGDYGRALSFAVPRTWSFKLPEDGFFSRDKRQLDGWSEKSDGSSEICAAGQPYRPTRDTTLYAQWGPVLRFDIDAADTTTRNSRDGSISISNVKYGGSVNFQYSYAKSGKEPSSWEDVPSGGVFTIDSLKYGEYTVTLRDAADGGNVWSEKATVRRPGDVNFAVNATNASHRGAAEGEIEVTYITGGSNEYPIRTLLTLEGNGERTEIELDGVKPENAATTSHLFERLTAGEYIVSLEDLDDVRDPDDDEYIPNIKTMTVVIHEPDAVKITSSARDNLRAPGIDQNGEIHVTASGGNGDYEYRVTNTGGTVVDWTAFGDEVCSISLPAGAYELYVRDPEDAENKAGPMDFRIYADVCMPGIEVLQSLSYSIIKGEGEVSLRVFASVPDGGELSYQWKRLKNEHDDVEKGENVPAEQGGTSPICWDSPVSDSWYVCRVTNTRDDLRAENETKPYTKATDSATFYVKVNSNLAVTKPAFYPGSIVVEAGGTGFIKLSARGSKAIEDGKLLPVEIQYSFSLKDGYGNADCPVEILGAEFTATPTAAGVYTVPVNVVASYNGVYSEGATTEFTVICVEPPVCSCLLLAPAMSLGDAVLEADEDSRTVTLSAKASVHSQKCALHRDQPQSADLSYEISGVDDSIEAAIDSDQDGVRLTVTPKIPGNHTVAVKVKATHGLNVSESVVKLNVYKKPPEHIAGCECEIELRNTAGGLLVIENNESQKVVDLLPAGVPALAGSCSLHTEAGDRALQYYWRVLENTAGASIAGDRLTVTSSGVVRLELKAATAHAYKEVKIEFTVKSRALVKIEDDIESLNEEYERVKNDPAGKALLRDKVEAALAAFYRLSERDRAAVAREYRKMLDELVENLKMMKNEVIAPAALGVEVVGLATVGYESEALQYLKPFGYTFRVGQVSGGDEYDLTKLLIPEGHTAGLFLEVELFRTLEGVIQGIKSPMAPLFVTLRLPESMKNGAELTIVHAHTGADGTRTLSVLPCEYDPDSNTVSFVLDRFSTLAFSNIPEKISSTGSSGISAQDSSKTLTARELESAAASGTVFTLESGEAFYRIDAAGALSAARRALRADTLPDSSQIVFRTQLAGASYALEMTVVYSGRSVNPSVYGAFVELFIPVREEYATGVFRSGEQLYHTPTAFISEEGGKYARLTIQTGFPYFLVWNETSLPGFGEVWGEHWSNAAVTGLAERLTLGGAEGGAYSPDVQISRAAFIAFALRAFGLDTTSEYRGTFTDIDPSDWYASAVQAAYDLGIVSGLGDGRFGPELPITREQATTILFKLAVIFSLDARLPKKDKRLDQFFDSGDISDWAEAGLDYALIHDLITGRGGWIIAPRAALSNAEAAQLIWNMLVKSEMI